MAVEVACTGLTFAATVNPLFAQFRFPNTIDTGVARRAVRPTAIDQFFCIVEFAVEAVGRYAVVFVEAAAQLRHYKECGDCKAKTGNKFHDHRISVKKLTKPEDTTLRQFKTPKPQ